MSTSNSLFNTKIPTDIFSSNDQVQLLEEEQNSINPQQKDNKNKILFSLLKISTKSFLGVLIITSIHAVSTGSFASPPMMGFALAASFTALCIVAASKYYIKGKLQNNNEKLVTSHDIQKELPDKSLEQKAQNDQILKSTDNQEKNSGQKNREIILSTVAALGIAVGIKTALLSTLSKGITAEAIGITATVVCAIAICEMFITALQKHSNQNIKTSLDTEEKVPEKALEQKVQGDKGQENKYDKEKNSDTSQLKNFNQPRTESIKKSNENSTKHEDKNAPMSTHLDDPISVTAPLTKSKGGVISR